MRTRRKFIQAAALLTTNVLLSPSKVFAMNHNKMLWMMPDEAALHQRTWMAFGASKKIWGSHLLAEVQKNLLTLALTIARFEPVTMLVRAEEYNAVYQQVGTEIELLICPLDDAWIRDTGPVFVQTTQGDKAAVNFNFNGWGNKQTHRYDAQVAARIADNAGVPLLDSRLVLEGGSLEVDGSGSAIITESCVLNDNRNPSIGKQTVEQELNRLLGIDKILWLPGIKDHDITDGHTDFYARFIRPGTVVVGYEPDPASFDHAITKRHLQMLRTMQDAKGRPLNIEILSAPSTIRPDFDSDEFAAGYINFYVCNQAVIAPEFGDQEADQEAQDLLQQLYPEREIVMINIDGIAAGGGGIHCVTQQEPA